MDYLTKWGLPPNYDEPKYTRCGQNGQKTKWCGIKKRDNQGSPLPDLHLEDRTRDTPMGHPNTKSKRKSVPYKNKRDAMLSM